MGCIDAIVQYEDAGADWYERLLAIGILAEAYAVGVRVERKAPPGEAAYYLFTVSADDEKALEGFISGLQSFIGNPDSPIFCVSPKQRKIIPALSKKVEKAPNAMEAWIEC